MRMAMTNFSLRHPWVVVAASAALTIGLAWQFPKVHFDNDPENMLSKDEHVRVFHHEVQTKYKLYDFVIAGIVNERHPDGVFNPDTLGRVYDLTGALLRLHRTPEGLPAVVLPARGDVPERPLAFDLRPAGRWRRALNVAFRHDPNRLFDAEGRAAVIAGEIVAPSVVDSIRQAELGALKIEYLMELPPATRKEALALRDTAMGNPLYNGTLFSEDGKAVCIYIPLVNKTYSHNVAGLVRALTADWPDEDRVLITGLPVAEDTFGVEMLVQMATSAPLAALAVFVLMLFFFRRLSLIVAPMLIAILSMVCTMGLLIGLGFDVHIMSSMIPIFLMPIAVADSVHILSEFFDSYRLYNDKCKTVLHVIDHLFKPMLYTSLTTIAGFASLALTPIPPVRVFGLHVAFGVALAWVLTMTLIPAYIMLAVSETSLRRLQSSKPRLDGDGAARRHGAMERTLEKVGLFTYRRWGVVLAFTLLLSAISAYGISLIRVNDNPVKWFTAAHPIRVADQVLNDHFGGTYTAYLTLAAARPDRAACDEKAAAIAAAARERFGAELPAATAAFLAELERLRPLYANVHSADMRKCFVQLVEKAGEIDSAAAESWRRLADAINYLDPQGLTYATLITALDAVREAPEADKRVLITRLQPSRELAGETLQEHALGICDSFTELSFREFVFEMEAELTAPLFKKPAMLKYVEGLQESLRGIAVVGKSSSAVDALKKASFELSYVAPPADADTAELAEYETRNRANYAVPGSVSAVAQVFTQLEGMKKRDALFHMVTRNYEEVNLWVQLTSGDNRDMEAVVEHVRRHIEQNPPPVELNVGWAGLTYLNVVWQDRMVKGMLSSLVSSFVTVLVMMIVLFRSPLFGVLSMLPLSVTIAFIYGLIGLAGKDYDMPVAILSALTLGLSVDFAIHFLERARELQRQKGSWETACRFMFHEPATAITRNAVTISIGFMPLLLAPLVPYRTVGFFLAAIMAVSWVATLLLLPSLLTMLRRFLFK